LGAYAVQKALGLAAIGGKDSMSGTFEKLHVPPTLVSFAVTTIPSSVAISPEFKLTDSHVVLVQPKVLKDRTTDFDVLKNNFDAVHHAILNQQIISAYSLKQFGVAEGLSKMSIGNDIGVEFNHINNDELFATNYGAMIVEIPKKYHPEAVLKSANFKIIGQTYVSHHISSKSLKLDFSIDEIKHDIVNKLTDVFVNTTPNNNDQVVVKPYANLSRAFSKKVVKKPVVVIPVFPGTNCEYDSQFAFERAGAQVKQVLICNLTSQSLLSSIKKLAQAIQEANIVMIPGGFSAGDEPDGSAKFIVNVFNNRLIKNAINDLLNKRDGLMLGICNGFQALIKLGLLPYGKIQKATSDSPTLTFNKIAHHMSIIVRTKIISNKSPWLAGVKPDQIHHIPISHGEGQFVASVNQIHELEKNGQIATQYVDLDNQPTMNMPFNPNGSTFAIEGITSIDGRVFGKMGHSERIGKNLYRNLNGCYDQKIFESGVQYFTHKK
jgi:phosphoribosylformylglycinamidine synthase